MTGKEVATMGRRAKQFIPEDAKSVPTHEARRLVFEAMRRVEDVRKPKLKDQKIVLKSIRYLSGLSTASASNALRWLRNAGVVESQPGREGWFLKGLPQNGICWKHGTPLKKNKGAAHCVICDNTPVKS